MAKTKKTLCVEHTEYNIEQDLELNLDEEDETVNEGNENLVEIEENVVQQKLDPSVESTIREVTSNIFGLNERNSISIRVSSDLSSRVSNVIYNVHDNSLESYLIGEMRKGMGDDNEEQNIPLEMKKHSMEISSINDKDGHSNTVTAKSKATQAIAKILKGLKFKSSKKGRRETKDQSKIDIDLLYIQKQMPKTKTTPKRGGKG